MRNGYIYYLFSCLIIDVYLILYRFLFNLAISKIFMDIVKDCENLRSD